MLYCQLDYPQELGTKDPNDPNAPTITIAEDGCALTCLASMLTNVFADDIDPEQLNQELINLTNGFATNGEGDFDLINWAAVTGIYADGELIFNFDKTYYNAPNGKGEPADMTEIDGLLSDGYSIIVGVSFNHNPQESTPTHYVEIYKKNPDGTYQMRDPMFRGDQCDTVFDTRYAVNGMSVANAILQVISYTGPLPEQAPVEPPTHKYNVGDTTQVYLSVATGAEPSAISFTYGEVAPNKQAKVIGFELYNNDWFYNVDQTAIGGGTGYARVEDIDKASVQPVNATPESTQVDNSTSTQTDNQTTSGTVVQIEPATTSTINNQTPSSASGDEQATQETVANDPSATTPETTATPAPQTPEEQIAQLQQEKGNLAQQLEQANNKYNDNLSKYQELVAAGYDTLESVVAKVEGVAKINVGLKKQLVQVLSNRKTLNDMLASRDLEDATAIDEGIKFEQKYKDLSGDMSAIAKIFKTKPTINDILSAADKIKASYDKVVSQLKKRQVKEAVQTAQETVDTMNVDPQAKLSVSALNSFFSFSWLKFK